MNRIAIIFVIVLFVFNCKDGSHKGDSEGNDDITTTVESEVDSMKLEDEKPMDEPEKKSVKQIKKELTEQGYKTFEYIDEKTNDTILMQQYFMAFLKAGPIRGQNEEETADLQEQHLAHLTKMYELGYADISGPFGDNGDIRGITIYNVPTQKMADSLATADPMVKAGRLEIEIRPWWAAKGYALR